MVLIRKITILFFSMTLAVFFACKANDSGSSIPPVSGNPTAQSSADSGDSPYNISAEDYEGGALTEESEQNITAEMEKADVSGSTLNLNVRVTIPASENPHSSEDCDLWATVIKPDTDEKLPTIVVATPYRRELMTILYLPLVKAGYNLMGIDIRGTGSSGGAWTSFDLVEQYDIRYVIDEFIPAQEWSDGKVGMIGPSYMAIIQMLTAGLVDRDEETGEPEHLKALFPLVPMTDAYRDIVMHGGNIDLEFIPLWLGMVDILGALPGLLNLGVDGPPNMDQIAEATAIWQQHIANIPVTIDWIMDANNRNCGEFFYKKSSMIYWPEKPEGGWGFPEGDKVIPSKLPVFAVGGWFDIFTRGTSNVYQHALSQHAGGDKRLIIGEFYHLGGSLGLGLGSIMGGQLPARWFDWKIKGKEAPFMEEFPVLLYVMGEKKWRAEKTWPLPADRTIDKTMYLTKQAPSPIDGDWYTDEPWWLLIKTYADNNYGLSEYPDFSGDNPVLKHKPLELTGLISRSTTRWLMGMTALLSQASKNLMGKDIDASQPFEDERLDEKSQLTFTSEPLDEDMEIVGPLTVTFWAKTKFPNPLTQAMVSSFVDTMKNTINTDSNLIIDELDNKDVQWVVELNDVFENGRARNITSGWLSAWRRPYDPSGATNEYYEGPWYNRTKVVEHALDPNYEPFDPFYRSNYETPKPINDGELYQYTVELWPTCNIFKKGHRVRLSISASDFPHLLPILMPSENTIVIDENHVAKIDFKTTNGANEGDTWKWIGDNKDADDYLMSGAASGCGTAANASSFNSREEFMLSGLMSTLFLMLFPMTMILGFRYIRRKKYVV